jgi:lipopolysaccharide transport system ATP-binding protein
LHDCGAEALLRAGAGVTPLDSGTIAFDGPRLLLHPDDAPHFDEARLLLIDQTLSRCDALQLAQAVAQLKERRRKGATILLHSHDEPLLLEVADEVWWLKHGRLAAQGAPGDVLLRYRADVTQRIREVAPIAPELSRAARRGDGRAQIMALTIHGESGNAVSVLQSGENCEIRVHVRFAAGVADPVVGMLIRTRIGLNVFGTNTELEHLPLGPRGAHDHITVAFRFRAELCPGEYTLTAASHDPDGVWHEWLEDAIAFTVIDSRYTAGVANLRAQASLQVG